MWWRRWLVAAVAGAVFTAVGTVSSVMLAHLRGTAADVGLLAQLWNAFRYEAPGWLAWLTVLPGLFLLFHARPIHSARDVRGLALHTLGFFAFHPSFSAATFAFALLVAPGHPQYVDVTAFLFRAEPQFTAVMYVGVSGLLHLDLYSAMLRDREVATIALAREQAVLEERLASERLLVLQRQLEPHFLFNTLNAISARFLTDPVVARRLLATLASVFRQALAHRDTHLVPVRDELHFIRDYLELQRARFGDRLTVCITAPPECLQHKVPWMIVQPIVENAITHGVGEDGTRHVAITVTRAARSLSLTVEDGGPGYHPAQYSRRRGLGLQNVRERLEWLYAGDARLEFVNGSAGGARASIIVPLSPDGGEGA